MHSDAQSTCTPDPPPESTVTPSCGDSTSTLAVVAARKDVLVATSRADGTIIAQVIADASGCASLTSEPDALVTIAAFAPPHATVWTTLAPTSGQLAVSHLRSAAPPPGRLCDGVRVVFDPATLPPGTDGLHLELGDAGNACKSTGFGSSLDFNGDRFSRGCLGSDNSMDLQVWALQEVQIGHSTSFAPLSYSAGRVTAVDDVVTFVPAMWGPTLPQCTVSASAGVPPLQPTKCTYVSDKVQFNNAAPGQVVDATQLRIESGGQYSYFTKPGFASAFSVTTDDLLPPIPASTVIADPSTMRLQWSSDLPVADLVLVNVSWERDDTYVGWNATLPPTATEVQFPAFTDTRLRPPNLATNWYPIRAFRTYMDSDALADYAAFLASGIHAGTTVDLTVSRVRLSAASGL
jgi:hypothetical protein